MKKAIIALIIVVMLVVSVGALNREAEGTVIVPETDATIRVWIYENAESLSGYLEIAETTEQLPSEELDEFNDYLIGLINDGKHVDVVIGGDFVDVYLSESDEPAYGTVGEFQLRGSEG